MIVTKQERTFLSCRIIQDSSSVSSLLSYLACVLPVHGVDGGARVHVHQVVVVVAGHHAPAPAHTLVELHGGGVDGSARHCGVRAVAPPASYLDTWPTPGGRSTWRERWSTWQPHMSLTPHASLDTLEHSDTG